MTDKELFTAYENYFTEKGWTFEQAAKFINVSRATLFNWKNGKPINPRGRSAMNVLVAKINSSVIKKPGDVTFLSGNDFVKVPLLSVAQAAELHPHANGSTNDIPDNETALFDKAAAGDFAVLVSGCSMEPWYPAGTKILVGREEKPQTGDRVIAMIADYNEPIFKIYVDRGAEFALLSINRLNGCEPIIIDKMDRGAWYWVWPIKASIRIERDVDAAMKKHGIRHFWEDWPDEHK